MPYIKQERRKAVEGGDIKNVGELNYYITMKILGYVKEKGESYATWCDAFSVLEMARIRPMDAKIFDYPDRLHELSNSILPVLHLWPNTCEALATIAMVEQEFYRRRIGPYESRKAEENGDVFT